METPTGEKIALLNELKNHYIDVVYSRFHQRINKKLNSYFLPKNHSQKTIDRGFQKHKIDNAILE